MGGGGGIERRMVSLERENAALRGELTAVRDFFSRDLAEMARRVAAVADARSTAAAADADARARIAALERIVARDARAVEALQAHAEDAGGGGGGTGGAGIDPVVFAKQMRASLDAGERAGALEAEVRGVTVAICVSCIGR